MLHCKDINAAATKARCKQLDRGDWTPAKNLQCSKAPPSGHANAVESSQDWRETKAEVLAMIKEARNGEARKAEWTGAQAEVLALIEEAGGGRPEDWDASQLRKTGSLVSRAHFAPTGSLDQRQDL